MVNKVNLDALVQREDFSVRDEETPAQLTTTIQIRDLESESFFYGSIRKPDFQRETNEWSIEQVSQFVQSFVYGDLIPSIILWKSGNYVFVIDGSHRLSALISWVQDDYGDGFRSRQFYEHLLPADQISVAEKTRKLINSKIGSYKDHKTAIQQPDKAHPELLRRAQNLGSLALQLQWVKGDANRAEASFFKINQQAAPINKTELRLLQSRKKANALAARAIVRSGTGHKYWSVFQPDIQDEIEKVSREIYDALFNPQLETPIKTLDLPLAGKGYSSESLPIVFDFVNLVGQFIEKDPVENDSDGQKTIKLLTDCRRVARRMSGLHPSSLGLHPAIYFYGPSGRYQPTAFFAMVRLIQALENTQSGFSVFSKARPQFEKFLLSHKYLAGQITYKLSSKLRGGPLRLFELYRQAINSINAGQDESTFLEALLKDEKFSFLRVDETFASSENAKFSTETKSAVFLKAALDSLLLCEICKGAIHVNSISVDHIIRKADGGLGVLENAQLSHPYCNTTLKN